MSRKTPIGVKAPELQATRSAGTATVNFSTAYASQPVILLFDETTEGGVKLSSKSPSGFGVACTGGSDVFDWIADTIGAGVAVVAFAALVPFFYALNRADED